MKKELMILIAGLAATFFATGYAVGQDSDMDIHGFISQGYFSSTENYFTDEGKGDSFGFNEVGLNFGKELTDDMRIGIQLFARDFSDVSSGEIMIDWAFVDYHFQDWLGLNFGQMKMPHGFYNESRDIDVLRNSIFLPESIYQELSHDLYVNDVYLALQGISSRDLFLSLQGIGIYGFLDFDALGGFSYQLLYGTQNLDTGNPKTFDKVENVLGEFLENENIDVDYKYAGNILWDTPILGLRLGVSLNNIKMSANSRFTQDLVLQDEVIGSTGDPGVVNYEKMEHWVGSVDFTYDNLFLIAEYISSNKKYDIELPGKRKKIDTNPIGWYVGGAYRIFDWLELGGYYSVTKGDNDDYYNSNEGIDFIPYPDVFRDLEDFVGTIRFDLNEYWVLKLETHHLISNYAETGLTVNAQGGLGLNYKNVEEKWDLYVAKMTVAF